MPFGVVLCDRQAVEQESLDHLPRSSSRGASLSIDKTMSISKVKARLCFKSDTDAIRVALWGSVTITSPLEDSSQGACHNLIAISIERSCPQWPVQDAANRDQPAMRWCKCARGLKTLE